MKRVRLKTELHKLENKELREKALNWQVPSRVTEILECKGVEALNKQIPPRVSKNQSHLKELQNGCKLGVRVRT